MGGKEDKEIHNKSSGFYVPRRASLPHLPPIRPENRMRPENVDLYDPHKPNANWRLINAAAGDVSGKHLLIVIL